MSARITYRHIIVKAVDIIHELVAAKYDTELSDNISTQANQVVCCSKSQESESSSRKSFISSFIILHYEKENEEVRHIWHYIRDLTPSHQLLAWNRQLMKLILSGLAWA